MSFRRQRSPSIRYSPSPEAKTRRVMATSAPRPAKAPLSLSITMPTSATRSEEHTSELQSLRHLVCRLLLEKKKITTRRISSALTYGKRSEQDTTTSQYQK